MDRRLGRTVAVMLVITALGGLLLADRADRLARRRAAQARVSEDAAALGPVNPESVRVVAAAPAAYDAERRARGLEPLATRVFAYVRDSMGVRVTLFPVRPVLGQDAVIRVAPDGGVQITEWGR